jgi:hypothetical protein
MGSFSANPLTCPQVHMSAGEKMELQKCRVGVRKTLPVSVPRFCIAF